MIHVHIAKKSARPAIALFHGTGGNEYDLLPVIEQIAPETSVISLRGTVSENGLPRFFKRIAYGVFDEADVLQRAEAIYNFLQTLPAEKQSPTGKFLLMGYSNGANIAGALLLLYPDAFAGAVLWRPMQPLYENMPTLNNSVQTPVLFLAGRDDTSVEAQANEQYREILNTKGFTVEYHVIPTGHNLTESDISFTKKWISRFST